MRKVYLAIPYTGMHELSYEQSTRMCALMISKEKINAFSPITHCHPLTYYDDIDIPGDWEYWKQVDYQYIDWADEMRVQLMYPDDMERSLQLIWDSKGVQEEIAYGIERGIPIYLCKFKTTKRLDYELIYGSILY